MQSVLQEFSVLRFISKTGSQPHVAMIGNVNGPEGASPAQPICNLSAGLKLALNNVYI